MAGLGVEHSQRARASRSLSLSIKHPCTKCPLSTHGCHARSRPPLHCFPGRLSLSLSLSAVHRPDPRLVHISGIPRLLCWLLSCLKRCRRQTYTKGKISLSLSPSALIAAGTQPHQCLPLHSGIALLQGRILPHTRYVPTLTILSSSPLCRRETPRAMGHSSLLLHRHRSVWHRCQRACTHVPPAFISEVRFHVAAALYLTSPPPGTSPLRRPCS